MARSPTPHRVAEVVGVVPPARDTSPARRTRRHRHQPARGSSRKKRRLNPVASACPSPSCPRLLLRRRRAAAALLRRLAAVVAIATCWSRSRARAGSSRARVEARAAFFDILDRAPHSATRRRRRLPAANRARGDRHRALRALARRRACLGRDAQIVASASEQRARNFWRHRRLAWHRRLAIAVLGSTPLARCIAWAARREAARTQTTERTRCADTAGERAVEATAEALSAAAPGAASRPQADLSAPPADARGGGARRARREAPRLRLDVVALRRRAAAPRDLARAQIPRRFLFSGRDDVGRGPRRGPVRPVFE